MDVGTRRHSWGVHPINGATTAIGSCSCVRALLNLAGDVLLLTEARVWRHRLLPGNICAMDTLRYLGSRFAVEFLRADRLEMGGLPMAQVIPLTLTATATVVLVWQHRNAAPLSQL